MGARIRARPPPLSQDEWEGMFDAGEAAYLGDVGCDRDVLGIFYCSQRLVVLAFLHSVSEDEYL